MELSSAKADTATTERQSMDIVIRFIFIVGRRRMAARLETELILSVVPFSIKSLTLQANCAAGCRCRYVVASSLQCFMLGFLRGPSHTVSCCYRLASCSAMNAGWLSLKLAF